MGIKVRKGLTTPLKILGMSQTYFYIWSAGSALCILLLGLSFNSFIQEGVSGFAKFLGCVLILAIISLVFKVYFTSKSSKKRLSFRKIEISISNLDLLRIIKRL